MRLMCDLELDFNHMSRHLAIDFKEYFKDSLSRMGGFESDGLLTMTKDKLVITNEGRLFIRNIAMEFDAYLDKSEARFSKTV